jgi:electron transport complex protein RnfA
VGEQFLILISAGLVSNLILDHMLGVDPVIAVSRQMDPALDLALLMLLVLPVTTTGNHLLNSLILLPLDLAHLQLTALVLTTCLLVLLTAWLVARFTPGVYGRIELYIPLILVNCSILGVTLLNPGHGLVESLFFGLGSAAGFGLILIVFSAIRERITVADVPVPFRGAAILLITLGLISMAFMGFNGMASFG